MTLAIVEAADFVDAILRADPRLDKLVCEPPKELPQDARERSREGRAPEFVELEDYDHDGDHKDNEDGDVKNDNDDDDDGVRL